MNRRNFIKALAAAVAAAPFVGSNVEPGAEQYGMAVGNDLANGDVAWAQGPGWCIEADGTTHYRGVFVRGELHANVFVVDEVRSQDGTLYIPAGTLYLVESHMQPVEDAGQWRTLADW